jgi:legumain
MGRAACLGALLTALGAAGERFAVLVAGSNSFQNYRHQADIAHAYKILSDGGLKRENIITMMADDVAHHWRNPFRGQLFNAPDAADGTPPDDVYAAVRDHIDYRHRHVTPHNFLKVLTGDGSAPGPVLRSGPEDEVFVYFADHGGVGIIAFPGLIPGVTGPVLHADKLNDALRTMASKRMFKRLVFYMEACESGSMFDGLLQPGLGVYAVTAANAHESSWGWYCGETGTGGNKVHGKSLGVCLGDLFSIRWMEDTDGADEARRTLAEQFTAVANATAKSHVQRFGNLSFVDAPLQTFLGDEANHTARRGARGGARAGAPGGAPVDSRDALVAYLRWRVGELEAAGAPAEELARARAELADEEAARRAASRLFAGAWRRLTGSDGSDLLTTSLPPRRFDCHRAAVGAARLAYTDYSLRFHRVVVNLCERGFEAREIGAAFDKEREAAATA